MEQQPVAGGRVKSIKSKFESLSSLESLDISGALLNSAKSKPFVKFQRSATSLDLFTANKPKSVVNHKQMLVTNKSSNIRRQSSDISLSKCDNRSTKASSALKEIKENVEQVDLLVRQTNDSSKRSSIRRSPAFRVGEKPIKAIAAKATKTVSEEHSPEKVDKLLKRSVDDDKFMQPGITDTLKAALRQPLPSGPPPKKPPRLFESPKEDISTIQLFEEQSLRERIGLKSEANEKSTKNQSSNLLSCIRCTTPIYDAVVTHSDDIIVNGSGPKSNISEHIYMEPFSHLKDSFVAKKQQCLQAPDIVTSSMPHWTNSDSSSKRLNSNCSCPEDHNEKGDLHYLVRISFGVFLIFSHFLPFKLICRSAHLHILTCLAYDAFDAYGLVVIIIRFSLF